MNRGLTIAADFVEEPCAGEGPVAFGGALADAEGEGGFVDAEAGEVTEFYEFGAFGGNGGEAVEGFVDGEEFVVFA